MIAIVESHADSASEHICEHLRQLADWDSFEDDSQPAAAGGGRWYRTDGAELRSFEAMHLDLESPAEAFECDPDLLVFASRHAGDTGALLTGHFTGNFGPAEFGGEEYALAEAAPNALAHLLEAFDRHAPKGYDVGLECTHHGPTDVGCPSLFAELGSGEAQWTDPAGARAVAKAILELREGDPHRQQQLVGFGGGHYVPRFERIVRETPWAVGHIAADWPLEAMGHPADHRDLLERAFETSHAEFAVIDGDRPDLEDVIAELGYRTVTETWLRTVGDRRLEVVDAVESELGDVADGIRFGRKQSQSFAVTELPAELCQTVQGIDPAATWDVIADRTVAFETENGGSRVGRRVAVPDGVTKRDLVTGLVPILEQRYDAVSVDLEESVVIVEETAFDPSRARTLGIPEGPAFGKLADGQPVTVDGDRIDPDVVHRRQQSRFPL